MACADLLPVKELVQLTTLTETEQQNYSKLAGYRLRMIRMSRNTLWLGKDHLLMIRNHGFTEEYKRFYYQDIQGLILRKTSSGTVWMILWGFIALVCLVVLISQLKEWPRILLVLWGILTAIAVYAFLENVIRGGTCVCHIRTAAHIQELSSLSRIRAAMKAVAAIIARIEHQQGFLSPEQLTTVPAALLLSAQPQHVGSAQTAAEYYDGTLHIFLFAAFISSGLLVSLQVILRFSAYEAISAILNVVLWVFMVLALIRQRQSPLSNSIKRLVWYGFGAALFSAISSSAYGLLYLFTPGMNPWRVLRAMKGYETSDSLPWLVLSLAVAAIYLLLGTLGLLRVLRYRTELKRPPA